MAASPPVRLGLVGAGRWGKNYIRTIRGLDAVVLSVIASGNPQAAAIAPRGCRIVPDWQTLVSSADIDGVIIATPPGSHAEILVRAVGEGKAVLVEKPLVGSMHHLADVQRAVLGRGAIVMVEHTHLFNPAFRALKAEARMLARPLAVRSSAGNTGPYRKDVSVLWDWAPHDLAMALDLVPGDAAVVAARSLQRPTPEGHLAERVQLTLKLSQDIPCNVTVSTLDEKHRWFAVDFEDRTLIFSDQGQGSLRVVGHSGADGQAPGDTIAVSDDWPLTVAVREFAQAVRERRAPDASLQIGIQVVELLARCEEAMVLERCAG